MGGVVAGRLFVIHWNGLQAEQRAGALAGDGWDVEIESADGAIVAVPRPAQSVAG